MMLFVHSDLLSLLDQKMWLSSCGVNKMKKVKKGGALKAWWLNLWPYQGFHF